MITKSEIKYYAALKQKKYRKIERKFLAEGQRLIEEGINSNYKCDRILVTNDFYKSENKFMLRISNKKSQFDIISVNDFLKISSTKNPQGIIAVFSVPTERTLDIKEKTIVILENISDPGNLGTILRTCDWFGISTILLSKDCADLYNPKVVRASMGAIFNLNVFINMNLVDEIKKIKKTNYSIHIADMEGQNYKKVSWQKRSAIVFANEANGPTEGLKSICNKVTIPQKGKVESLNVAAAAAVIIAEAIQHP